MLLRSAGTVVAQEGKAGGCFVLVFISLFFFVFLSFGAWVKIELELPHFHVSDTCRVSI